MIKYAKVRQVKSPNRGTGKSVGIDFYVPKFTEKFIKDIETKNNGISKYYMYADEKRIFLPAHERILIPSGIHMNLLPIGKDINNVFLVDVGIETGIAIIAHNKSGVGSKLGLDRLAEVVDEDYQGEIHISVVNTGNIPISISEDDKLIQFLAMPVIYPELNEVFIEDLYTEETERGAGGFGTGTGTV